MTHRLSLYNKGMEIREILPLLRDIFGNTVSVAAAHALKEDLDYHVFDLTLRHPDQQIILKLGGSQAQYNCEFERLAAIHALVRARTSVPVAEIIAADETYQKYPWRFLIKSFTRGVELAQVEKSLSPEDWWSIKTQLGRAVAELHQITFSGFGQIDLNGRAENTQAYPDALRQHAMNIIKQPAAQTYFSQVLEQLLPLFVSVNQPCLCHEDLHKYNILVHKHRGHWEIAAILDFEKAWAGHNESDLARMDLWGMSGDDFWQTYRVVQPVDNGYRERQPVYELLWCLEYAEQSPEHLETTRQVCQKLGLPPITCYEPFIF